MDVDDQDVLASQAFEAPQPSIGSDVPILPEETTGLAAEVELDQQVQQPAVTIPATTLEGLGEADQQSRDSENLEEATQAKTSNAPEPQMPRDNVAEMLREQLLQAQQKKISEEQGTETRRGPARSRTPIPIPIPNPELKPSNIKASYQALPQTFSEMNSVKP